MNKLTYFNRSASARWFWPYICLSLLCFALYLPGIFTIPMDDRDSAHFAQASRQMLETGNYFQIRYQEVTRYQKPPGINWLQALSVKAFSSPESNNVWPYRLPSVVGGWLSVLLTFFFAQKLCGRSIAFIASTLLASTVLLNIESHLATIDASMLVSVVLMQGALWMVYEKAQRHEPIHWKWPLIFFLSMAYGILLKGITPLVGFLTLLTLSVVDKTTLYFKKLRIFWGLLLLLVLTAAWLIAVSYAEHTNYLMQMINRDLLPKLAGGHESHGAPFGTHLALLVVTFWPASLFLWPTVVRTWQQCAKSIRPRRKLENFAFNSRNEALENPSLHVVNEGSKKMNDEEVKQKNQFTTRSIERFLLAWIIPVWIFFEFMPTKLPQYILPIFPALAILGAYALMEKTAQDSRIMRILTGLWCLVSIGLAAAFLIIPIKLNLSLSSIPSAYWVTAILTITTLVAVVWIFNKNYLNALILLIFGNCLGFGIGYQCYLPQLTPVWASEHIKQTIQETIPGKIDNDHPLISIGYAEPSLVFLLGTHAVKFDDVTHAIQDLKSSSSYAYVLVDKDSNENFLATAQANMLFPKLLQTITSFNYTKGHWVTLTLYRL